MRTLRTGVAIGLVGLLALTSAGCSLVRGPADRTDEFAAAGQQCTGSWWLGDLREGTDPEALEVAERALAAATVKPEELADARNLLDDSKNEAEREGASAVDFESEAYMLTVTLAVKDELDAAGYPDIDRVIEIWSERSCS